MTKSVTVIQARTNSSRLPAKVLLPIRGIPLAVLVAKRASNTGRETIVVTSDESSDDALFNVLSDYNQKCFRGSLNNVLERFVSALSSYEDSTIVFRLTADNVFPDGAFLDEMEEEFKSKNVDYLCCNGEESGLPYGLSVEVTLLKYLRNAHCNTDNKYDIEHVTPYIRRMHGESFFQKYKNKEKENYRCTIDTLDDYINIQKLLEDVVDPIDIPVMELVNRLERLHSKPISKHPMKKIVVGGAQLGFDYGIANKLGQPSRLEAAVLLKVAILNGVEYVDTAHAYGNSERVIGEVLGRDWGVRVKVITKLSPLADCPDSASYETKKAFVESSVYRSCFLLKREALDCLMLHRASHLYDKDGIWQVLLLMLEDGAFKSLGVSVQTPEELLYALEVPEISYIQFPYNIVDNRWAEGIFRLQEVKRQRSLYVHVRSVFLQGLLLSNDNDVWERVSENHQQVRKWLVDKVRDYNRDSIIDLCLAFVKSQSWIDGVVLGMETADQLKENIALFSNACLDSSTLEDVDSTRPKLSDDFLNPAKWKVE